MFRTHHSSIHVSLHNTYVRNYPSPADLVDIAALTDSLSNICRCRLVLQLAFESLDDPERIKDVVHTLNDVMLSDARYGLYREATSFWARIADDDRCGPWIRAVAELHDIDQESMLDLFAAMMPVSDLIRIWNAMVRHGAATVQLCMTMFCFQPLCELPDLSDAWRTALIMNSSWNDVSALNTVLSDIIARHPGDRPYAAEVSAAVMRWICSLKLCLTWARYLRDNRFADIAQELVLISVRHNIDTMFYTIMHEFTQAELMRDRKGVASVMSRHLDVFRDADHFDTGERLGWYSAAELVPIAQEQGHAELVPVLLRHLE